MRHRPLQGCSPGRTPGQSTSGMGGPPVSPALARQQAEKEKSIMQVPAEDVQHLAYFCR